MPAMPLERPTVERELLSCLHVENLSPQAIEHVRAFCGYEDVKLDDYSHDNVETQNFHTAVYLNTSMSSRSALKQALHEVEAIKKSLAYSTDISRSMSPENINLDELKLMLAMYQASAAVRLHLRIENGQVKHSSKLDDAVDSLREVGKVLKQLCRAKNRLPVDELPTGDPADTPLRYIGMRYIAPALLKAAQDTSHPGPNDSFFSRMLAWFKAMREMTLQDWADKIRGPASLNNGRLYLVWTDEWINQDLNVLRLRMPNISFGIADGILAKLALLTGSMGWILYFTQVAIEGGIYVQNTCDMRDTWLKDIWPSWLQVTEEVRELQLTHEELARAQPFERKVLLWNNGVWGAVNYICFFFLTGFWGDALNGALFLFDYALTYKQLEQAQKDHDQVIADFDAAIEKLNNKLLDFKEEHGEDSPQYLKLKEERDALMRARKKTVRDWAYEVTQGRVDLFYSGSVVFAFAILCAFFWPSAFSAIALLSFALLGSFMCFSLGIAYDAVGLRVQISKEREVLEDADAEFEAKLDVFKQRLTKTDMHDPKARHELEFLYLILKDTVAETDFQHELIRYHQYNMWVKIFTEAMFPILFISTFVFLPLHMAFAGFGLGLFMMVVAKSYVDEMAPLSIREESRTVGWFTSALNKTFTFFRGVQEEEPKELESPLKGFDKFCTEMQRQMEGEYDKAMLKGMLLPPSPEPPEHTGIFSMIYH